MCPREEDGRMSKKRDDDDSSSGSCQCECPGNNNNNNNKTENQSETCGLLKLDAVEGKTEDTFGLICPENPQVPVLEAVGAI